MKKTLIIITAITLLFTACNADATSGLFRTATQAREAINIQYTQIVGREAVNKNLYFLTKEGLFVKENNAKSSSLILKSVAENRIQRAAYIDGTTILIKTDKDNGSLFEFNLSTKVKTSISIPSTAITDFRLMPNGKIVLIGAKDSGDFWITDKDGISTYNAAGGLKINTTSGFGLDGLYIPSDYENPTSNPESLLSFIHSDSSVIEHYYFDGTNLNSLDNSIGNIANYAKVGTNLYVLTKKGEFYVIKSGSYSSADKLAESAADFKQYGFFYPIIDVSNIYFITNPLYTDSMTIFTVDTSDSNMKTTIKTTKDGFAAALKDTHIVSSLQLDANEFLVATEKHGMYRVEVTPANVPTGGGTVSPAEEYTF